MRTLDSGALSADLKWYTGPVEAGRLVRSASQERNQPLTPAFLLHDGNHYSLIVPAAAGTRLDSRLSFQGDALCHLLPTEVVERGVDFVRYTVKHQ